MNSPAAISSRPIPAPQCGWRSKPVNYWPSRRTGRAEALIPAGLRTSEPGFLCRSRLPPGVSSHRTDGRPCSARGRDRAGLTQQVTHVGRRGRGSERAVGHGATPAGTTECGRVQTHRRDTAPRWACHRHLPLRLDRTDGTGQAGGAGLARRRPGAPALVRGGVEPRRQQDLRSDGRPRPATPCSRSSTSPASRRTSPSTSSTTSTRRCASTRT